MFFLHFAFGSEFAHYIREKYYCPKYFKIFNL